jgi:ABC-type maltose transport system permease subunit
MTAETHELHVSLDEKQKKLTEYQTNIANIEKYASDLQTFIAVKQIEKDVETHDTCLQSLINSLGLSIATTLTLVLSNTLVSSLRGYILPEIRLMGSQPSLSVNGK